MTDERGVCSICGEPYSDFGHNARPVNDGRCCGRCNAEVVIPARVGRLAQAPSFQVPEGFRPHTFASLVAKNLMVLPTMARQLAKAAAPEIDDAVEIGPGVEVITRLERQGVIQFAENAQGEPALFALPAMRFTNEADRLAADRMVAWFDRTGDWQVPVDSTIAAGMIRDGSFADWIAARPLAVQRLTEDLHLSRKVVESILERWFDDPVGDHFQTVAEGAPKFRLRDDASPTEWRIWHALSGLLAEADARNHPRVPRYEHQSYMRAVEAQYKALAVMQEVQVLARREGTLTFDGIPAADLWEHDIWALKRADTFCWFAEPLHAVDVAAASLPETTVLRRELTEGVAGWWWFMEPYPLRTTRETDTVVALLWHWSTHEGKSAMRFTAYVEGQSGLLPTTSWVWYEGSSLAEMLPLAASSYREMRGEAPLGPDVAVHAIDRLSRLFAAGAIWVEQKILVYTEGPVERHERKRMERGGLQRPNPEVAVIELRRRHAVPIDQRPGETRHVDWSCRWIVRGHWREQWYPSEGIHRSKFIESYPKGPDDKPLRVPTHTVYTVKR